MQLSAATGGLSPLNACIGLRDSLLALVGEPPQELTTCTYPICHKVSNPVSNLRKLDLFCVGCMCVYDASHGEISFDLINNEA